MAMAGRSVGKIGPFMYPLRPTTLDPSLAGLTHVPIKEGLQSIIKCLKAQDINNISEYARISTSVYHTQCFVL